MSDSTSVEKSTEAERERIRGILVNNPEMINKKVENYSMLHWLVLKKAWIAVGVFVDSGANMEARDEHGKTYTCCFDACRQHICMWQVRKSYLFMHWPSIILFTSFLFPSTLSAPNLGRTPLHYAVLKVRKHSICVDMSVCMCGVPLCIR